MLMIDHFLERETKLLEISKRGEEKYLNSNVWRIFLGGYFAISHLLHALSAVLLCLLHSPSGASRPQVSSSKRNTAERACSN